MGRGYHRQGLRCHVKAVPEAVFVDPGKATAGPVGRAVGNVEEHVGGLVEAHLAEDGAAHDIARRQLSTYGQKKTRTKQNKKRSTHKRTN